MKAKNKNNLFASILSIFILLINMFSGITVLAESDTPNLYTKAQDVIDFISDKKPVISSDGKTVILPESPSEEYEVSLYGSDNKQIIDMDLNYYQPISDKNVNVLYKVAHKTDNEDYATSSKDISIKVKGMNDYEEGDNLVPNVIPGLQEWKGSTGDFKLLNSSKLVVNSTSSDSLMEEAKLIQKYFKKMLDIEIAIIEGSKTSEGDIYLTINDTQEHLGEEGYTLEISDKIIVSASKPRGVNYGGISLAQILYQSQGENTIPKGIARDYPKYEVRSGMLDVGRMYIPLEYVQEMTEYMAWFKLNEIQMHINDYWYNTDYSAFRIESLKYPEINAEDGYYTQKEYIKYQKDMKKLGIDVVTEIDTPYHAESFRAVNPDMMWKKGSLDIRTEEKRAIVYPFIESLFDEFLGEDINDPNRVFLSSKFHIGTDEYDRAYSEEMRHYTDHFIKYVNAKGYESRLWGSIGKEGFDGETEITNEATMNIWSPNWSDVHEMYDLGYDIINTTGGDLYIVPVGNVGFPDYLNIKDKYDVFEVNNFDGSGRYGDKGVVMPFAHPQTKGAEFALWNDMTSFTGGISSYDIFDRVKDAVMLVSEKTWYGEKTEGQTSEQFMERVDAVQNKTPLSNPARHVESKTPIVFKYDFESIDNNKVKDISGNDYHAEIKGGSIADNGEGGTLQLDGSNYLELPISGIGYPYSVSFDIKLDEGSLDDATLFSGDDGDFYLNFNQTDKIGYQRNEKTSKDSLTKFENYTFGHDYKLKENEWQNVTLVGDEKDTTLFINGKRVSTSKQTNKLELRTNDSSSFVLPLEKIGYGIKGEIDNITLMKDTLSNSLRRNVAYQSKVTASTEYNGSQRASFITDGELDTRWASSYTSSMSEKERDNQWFLIELDHTYNLDEVKIYWEKSRAQKYKVLVSEDGETFDEVYSHTYNPEDGETDTISLKDVNARYLKVVMSERTTTGGKKYGYSVWELEAFGEHDVSYAERLIDEVEQLLDSLSPEVGSETAKAELIVAKDELKTYLSNADIDVFTYDILTENLITKLDKFKKTIDYPRNLAYKQKVTASSEYNDSLTAAFLTDGELGTRWASENRKMSEEEKDNQWIMVELDDSYEMDTVKLYWEAARAEDYKLLVSKDGNTFKEVYSHIYDSKEGKTDIINLEGIDAKYLKVVMSKRVTPYGYSLYELEAYNFSEAKKMIRDGEKALNETPAESSGENERTELTIAMDRLNAYLSERNLGFEYYLLTKRLESKIENYEKSIVHANKVTIDQTNVELLVNESIKLNATVEPANAINKEVKWSSSNDKVATVDKDGKVNAISKGNAEIKVMTIDGKHEVVSNIIVKEVIEKSVLESAVTEAEHKNEADYTNESWMVFSEALSDAKEVLKNDEATQEAVDRALEGLIEAIDQLEEIPVETVDKSELESAVKGAEAINEADYTKASWKIFSEALSNAKEVLENDEATQEAVDEALEGLIEAIDQLEEIPEETVDKSELELAVTEAEAKNEADYTKASWKIFSESLSDAKEVLENDEATREAVDEALEGLIEAIDQLEEIPEETVDKSELETAVTEAEAINESGYTKASWKVFSEALSNAKEVLENEEATQEAVDEALEGMIEAIDQLEEIPEETVDKSELETAVTEAEAKNEADYTKASWKVFSEALSNAKEVLENDEATREAVDEALEEMIEAIDQLEEIPEDTVDKSELETAVTEAEVINESDYTKASWKVFSEALSNAKDILENDEATQEAVDEALESLIKATDQLVEQIGKLVDKSALKTMVTEAEKKNEADYTKESWKVFSEALSNAKKVLENDEATQNEIIKVLTELEDAMANLVKVNKDNTNNQEDKPNPNQEPGKGLPKTATNMFNLLLMGGLLLLVGSVTYLIRAKRRRLE